jgi:acyl-CoA synthetase (NDP forming)
MSVTELRPASVTEAFQPLFEPKAIAVAGASATGTSAGNRFIRVLKQSGYRGRIMPIHPTAGEIEGLPAYASLAAMPEVADYAYLTVPADRAEAVLAQAGGRVRFAQVMASGAPDTHLAWEERLAGLAKAGGFRILGPNCMGTHSPRGRFTFMEGVATGMGRIGIGCQSGGLGMDILRRGQNLGLAFSGLVTLGNSIDVDPAELFEFYLADPATGVIGFYIEDVKDGARFQRLARRNRGRKPVVLLVGGVTALGRKAASSHTGAMAGSGAAWEALARQTGMILTQTLDTFLDALQLCACLHPRPDIADPTVTLFGNGGGASVLATDALDRGGFRLAEPPAEARRLYGEISLPPGASLDNPIDLPASVLKEEEGRVTARILQVNREVTRPYATIVHLNLHVIMGYRHVEGFLPNLMESVFGGDPSEGSHQILVLRSDRSEEADSWRRTFRREAAARGVASFDEIPEAVAALAAFRRYESFLATEREEVVA